MKFIDDLRCLWAGLLISFARRRTDRVVERGYWQLAMRRKCENEREKTRERSANGA